MYPYLVIGVDIEFYLCDWRMGTRFNHQYPGDLSVILHTSLPVRVYVLRIRQSGRWDDKDDGSHLDFDQHDDIASSARYGRVVCGDEWRVSWTVETRVNRILASIQSHDSSAIMVYYVSPESNMESIIDMSRRSFTNITGINFFFLLTNTGLGNEPKWIPFSKHS